jgi:hypothetical protein
MKKDKATERDGRPRDGGQTDRRTYRQTDRKIEGQIDNKETKKQRDGSNLLTY